LNLVLIGYRGTGKTAIAELLATALGLPCLCLDQLLISRFGKPIPEFVGEKGWDAFRDEETALVSEVAVRDGLVIDCGGGVVVRPVNITTLKRNGRLVWLKARPETIRTRLRGDYSRPSLSGTKSFLDEVTEILAQRTPLYQAAADWAIDTDELAIPELVKNILTWWHEESAT